MLCYFGVKRLNLFQNMQFYLSFCYKSLLFLHLKLKAFFCKNYKTEHF